MITNITNIFSRKTLKKFAVIFVAVFSPLAIIESILDITFQGSFDYSSRLTAFFLILGVSILFALFMAYPRSKFSKQIASPDVKITIKIGDLFNEKEHLVIGMNDVFDTELGEIIEPTSIQGQFLQKFFNNDAKKLDQLLSDALKNTEVIKIDEKKTKGKNRRYPIGTVAVLDGENRKYFCSAYSKMQSDLVAKSDIAKIGDSLNKLWEKIREKSNQRQVAIPLIGSALARVDGVSNTILLKLIIFSFILASKKTIVTKELVIVLNKKDIENVNLVDIREFLNNIST